MATEGPASGGPDKPPGEFQRAIESRGEFQAAVRQLISAAASTGARQMWWVSPDFDDWPLEDAALLDILTGWVRSSAAVHVTWLADDFEPLRRRMPRLVRWRQTWAHVLNCGAPVERGASDLPSLLLVEGAGVLQMFDRVHWRGRISNTRPDLGQAREQIDALLQRSEPSFPVTTLGI
ncbi:MAG TPA: hypothetical protein VLA16_10245 [Ideonella sp.]|nr:hypothetical protein [Ideonella sp.]